MPGAPLPHTRILALLTGCALLAWLASCGDGPATGGSDDHRPVRVLIVDLHGFIGCGADAELITQPIAEEIARVRDPIDVVVFSIDSGGGMLNRVGPLSDLIHERIRPRWRIMAWIERAESASALVALSIPELWMPPDGLIGGAVGVQRDPETGGWVELPSETQEAIRYVAAACAARGGHDPDLALSMTIAQAGSTQPLSGGEVLTGSRARENGLVQNADSLDAMLNQAFGENGWEIDTTASAAVSSGIAERGDDYALAAADGYFDDLLAISVREDPPSKRVNAFLGLFEWIDGALDRMDAVPGEPGR